MGNKKVPKEKSEDSLDFNGRGLSGGSGEINQLEGDSWFADDEIESSNSPVSNYALAGPSGEGSCRRCSGDLNSRTRYCRDCYRSRTGWMPLRPTRKLRKRAASGKSRRNNSEQHPSPKNSAIFRGRWMRCRQPISSSSSSDTDFIQERREAWLRRRNSKKQQASEGDNSTESSESVETCFRCQVRTPEVVFINKNAGQYGVCGQCAISLKNGYPGCTFCAQKLFISRRKH